MPLDSHVRDYYIWVKYWLPRAFGKRPDLWRKVERNGVTRYELIT